MIKKTVFVLLIFLAIIPFIGNATAGEKETKVYVVYLANADESYVLGELSNVSFLSVNCLKGKQIEKGWMEGKTVYVPIDKVKSIVEFNSYEEYLAAVKKFNEENVEK